MQHQMWRYPVNMKQSKKLVKAHAPSFLKKNQLFFLCFLLPCLLLLGCQKKEQTTDTALPHPSITSTAMISPFPTDTMISPLPSITPAGDYITYPTKDSVIPSISIHTSENKIQIIKSQEVAEFVWDYDLSLGEPIISSDEDFLYIILPTAKDETYLNVPSICGIAHIIRKATLSEVTYDNPIQNYIAHHQPLIENRENPEATNETQFCVNLFLRDGCYRPYYYTALNFPIQNEYKIVLEDIARYTNSLNEYRRLGILVENEVIWVGKFCYHIAGKNPEEFLFLPDQNLQYSKENGFSPLSTLSREERILNGENIVLDPDDTLDLDGDGVKERICYEPIPTNPSDHIMIYTITVNNSSMIYEGVQVDPTLFTGSLDGKTIQLMLFDNGPSCDPQINIYYYTQSNLGLAGVIPSYQYTLTKEGIEAYCESCHIQCYAVPFLFRFNDNHITSIERDFYPQGNTVTTLREIPLYQEKNTSSLGITLKKGSQVVIVGSDLKEWVYIKDVSSGKCGWLQTSNELYFPGCLLPDGTNLPATDLFDGLTFYG